MRLAVLFSGGKDSFFVLRLAMKYSDVACLVTLVSENKDSYMFHTPGQNLLSAQAEAVGVPIILYPTKGVENEELSDLEGALAAAKRKHRINGVVTGALASTYQATRVQKACLKLGLACFNPLWQKDQLVLLHEMVEDGFVVAINAVAAEPFDANWLGVRITEDTIDELSLLSQRYHINPAGEGGEYETFILDSPIHKKRLLPEDPKVTFDGRAGRVEYGALKLFDKKTGKATIWKPKSRARKKSAIRRSK